MEETNYDRAPLEMTSSTSTTPSNTSPKANIPDVEKFADTGKTDSEAVDSVALRSHQPKTYLQKLKLLDKPRSFRIPRMMVRPFIFLSLPAVAYAGFSYGSNLIWFNVLNGTTSLILGGAPYHFSVRRIFV